MTQAKLAQATYLLGVSSPAGWHGPRDYELKDKNGSRSGFAPGGREATFSPSQTTRPRPAWMEGGGSQGRTLTDFAVDSHLQLQALVFLMVDRFGCKINPYDVKERAFARRQELKPA